MSRRGLIAALAAVACLGAAADPSERLADPAQEARARAMFATLRCVVCQNESIDDSNADLAGDIRRLVRAQVAEGRSDPQIRRFLVARYGEFILLKPRFSPGNALLWLSPAMVVVLGGAYLAAQARGPRREDPPLDEAEQQALLRLIDEVEATVPPHKGLNNPTRG